MADNSLDVSVGGTPSMSLQMGGDGDTVKRQETDRVEFDTDDLAPEEEDQDGDAVQDDAQDAPGESGSDDDSGESEEDAGDDEGADDEADLGDFDPEDEEVVAKFDAKYLTEDGQIDAEGSLSAEFFANAEKGIEGLNEGTYAYLESKGISKATVKQIEAMAATQKDAATKSVVADDIKLMSLVSTPGKQDGPERLQAALAWGKEGGYDADAQKRFNAVMKGKDYQAKADAVEALVARYEKANPPKKPTLPKRDATKGQGQRTSSIKPYASRAEMQKAMKGFGDNRAAWETHKQRLAVSKFD